MERERGEGGVRKSGAGCGLGQMVLWVWPEDGGAGRLVLLQQETEAPATQDAARWATWDLLGTWWAVQWPVGVGAQCGTLAHWQVTRDGAGR